MKVNLKNAVKMFFGRSSLESVYLEAVSNALDAEATQIDIECGWDGKNVETIIIDITDNGVGFDDDRFKKFCNLFDVQGSNHKGLGRLSYLFYFNKIEVNSTYSSGVGRKFVFDENFEAQNFVREENTGKPNGSKLHMSDYSLKQLHKKDYLSARYLHKRIYEEFLARLYQLKQEGKHITINIKSYEKTKSDFQKLDTNNFPEFDIKELDQTFDLFNDVKLYYSVQKSETFSGSIITSVAIDDRCYKFPIIDKENILPEYEMIFLLVSPHFEGRSDATRQSDTFSAEEKNQIQAIFKSSIKEILGVKVPQIEERNNQIITSLNSKFPHLMGYFKGDRLGFVSQIDLIKNAQENFLLDQRELLGATHLTEEQYEKSMDLASRTLAQYIMFRQNVIDKLKNIKPEDKETVFHNILVPQHRIMRAESIEEDLYTNNIWVLDEKFMTYATILSEKDMKDVVEVITAGEETTKEDERPDIVIVFSDDPKADNKKVDVVIIELKKKELSPERNSDVEIQLETRVRALCKYYNKHIQRAWYYGVVTIDDSYAMHLETREFAPLYSKGRVYSKNLNVSIAPYPNQEKVPATIFIMDIDTITQDADARNSTFLNILKSKFKDKI